MSLNSKGMSKVAFAQLKKMFPKDEPKLGDSLEKVMHDAGQQKVISYIERYLVND